MADEPAKKNPLFEDRDIFIDKWSKMFKCKSNAFDVAAALINNHKNFQSASAILFGLSYVTHKKWLVKCAEHWQNAWMQYPKGTTCTADWCVQFQQYYITEVDKYPADG